MICKRRYIDNMQRYEKQIQKEILQYIDFQSTASDALFLVRWVTLNIEYSVDSIYYAYKFIFLGVWPLHHFGRRCTVERIWEIQTVFSIAWNQKREPD